MAHNEAEPVTSPQSQSKQASGFVSTMRKIYRPMGFSKGYNFPLFFVFAGAMVGFSLARLSYLNISGASPTSFKQGSSPGEWYHYRKDHYRIGLTLHLAACLPAGILMVFQFIPVIRHKLLIFHRINGYLVMLLTFVSNVGALMICRRSFGGGLDTQSAVGTLVILTTVSISMAYYNIKRLQIDQHRAWMLRAMFYMGVIITTRLIMILSATIITTIGDYYQVQTCDKVLFNYGGDVSQIASRYPQCVNRTSSENPNVVVLASLNNGLDEEIGASLGLSFGFAIWMSLLLHLVGVEIYLNLTDAENERLRNVSYERQLEAGCGNPGSAGLTSDRWGDVPEWRPASQKPSFASTETAN